MNIIKVDQTRQQMTTRRCARIGRRGGTVGTRHGYTLIELVSSLVTMSMLLAGMASAIKLASLAAPRGQNATSAALSTTDAMEMLTNDLRYALTVTNQTATQMTITVPENWVRCSSWCAQILLAKRV